VAAFRSIPPQQAIELVERAGVANPQKIIIDFAGAGLLKAYSLQTETVLATGEKNVVRGGTIPAALWKRVQSEGHSEDVWRGGTVRLSVDSAKGLPEVNITGMSFSEASLRRLAEHHGGGAPAAESPAIAPKPHVPAVQPAPAPPSPTPSAIPPGAIFVTVKQAMAALGLGRTKVNEMMNDGRLVRQKVDRSTLIEVESIRRLAKPPASKAVASAC
jgi:hypothetical protein